MTNLNQSFSETCSRLRKTVFGTAPLRQRLNSFGSRFVHTPSVKVEQKSLPVAEQVPSQNSLDEELSSPEIGSSDVEHPSPPQSIADRPHSPVAGTRSTSHFDPISSSFPSLTPVQNSRIPFPYKDMVDYLCLKAALDHTEKEELRSEVQNLKMQCDTLTEDCQTHISQISALKLASQSMDEKISYLEKRLVYLDELENEKTRQQQEISRLEAEAREKEKLELRLRTTEMEILDRTSALSRCELESREFYRLLREEREKSAELEEKLCTMENHPIVSPLIPMGENATSPVPPLRDHHVPVYFIRGYDGGRSNKHVVEVALDLPTVGGTGYHLIFCPPDKLESLYNNAFQHRATTTLPFVFKDVSELEPLCLHLQELSQTEGVIVSTILFTKEMYQTLQRVIKVDRIIFYALQLDPESGGDDMLCLKTLRGIPAATNRTVFVCILDDAIIAPSHFKSSGFSKTRPFELTSAILNSEGFWGRLGLL